MYCRIVSHFTNHTFYRFIYKYKIFKIKKFLFNKIFKSSFFLTYNSWFSTISSYIYKNIHWTDILIRYKIFYLNIWSFCLIFFQKSSMFLYKSWFSTISFKICQNIHFTDILIKYKNVYIKIWYIFFFKSRHCFHINIYFLQFLLKSAKIYVSQIYIYISQIDL